VVPSLAIFFLVSVEIAGVFLVGNLVFTVTTRLLGPRAHRLAYPLAALLEASTVESSPTASA
jgi:preprotein translocase subunit SecB